MFFDGYGSYYLSIALYHDVWIEGNMVAEAKHDSDQTRKPDRLQYRKKLLEAYRRSLDHGNLGIFEVNEDDFFALVDDD